MARILWSREALRNLDAIADYLFAASPQYAAALLTSLVESPRPLARFPRLGRPVPEFDSPELREIIVESYRLVYSIDGDTIIVVTVLHAAMDVAARLRKLGESN